MKKTKITRRRFVATTAAASATMIAAPFVRTANAAGKLSIGFWDHWVPGANKTSQALVEEWAAKEKVEVQIDYITSQGNKNLLTIAAEAQAKSGHDILAMPTGCRQPRRQASRAGRRHHGRADQAERRGQRHGRISRQDRRHVARGAGHHRQPDQGPVLAHRPDEAACRHRRAGDVSGRQRAQGRRLDLGHLPEGRRSLPQGRLAVRHRPRHDDGLGRHAGAIFTSSAPCCRREGRTSRSRPTRFARRSIITSGCWRSCRPTRRPGTMRPTTSGWSSGKGALIMNPPSAWAVAKRDAPQVAEQCWNHGMPAGPNGRFGPFLPYLWGIWNFCKNKSAAKSLLGTVAAGLGRKDGRGQRRLRHAVLRQPDDV